MDGFFGIGVWEMLVIAVIALVVLGPKQMIVMSRKAGEYLRQFRELWTQLSAAWQKEINAMDSTDVVTEVSKEIQGLKQDMQKTIQTLQGEVTTAATIAPPTTAKPTTQGTLTTQASPTAPTSPTVLPSPPPSTAPTTPANGSTPVPESTEAEAEQAQPPAPPPSNPTYSAWIDKSNQG